MLVAAEDKCVLVYALGDASESNHGSDPSSSPLLVAKLIGHANRCVRRPSSFAGHSHDFRVKSLDVHVEETGAADSPRRVFVVTVSSDGFVRLFDLSDAPSSLAEGAEPASIECISSYDTKGTRLTCVAFADAGDSADNALGKRKRLQADTGDQDEDEESDGVEQDEPNESGEESDSSR